MSETYADLLAATNFSFLRGASHAEELVETAVRMGLTGLGIADRNTVAGVVRAYEALKRLRKQKADLELARAASAFRLLTGTRLVLTDTPVELAAYPRDRRGWGNLTRLLTEGNIRSGVKGQCHLTVDDLAVHGEDILFIAVAGRRPDETFVATLTRLRDMLGERLYLGVALDRSGDDQRRLAAFSQVATHLRLPLLGLGDTLYHDPARRRLADILTAIREKTTVAAAGYRLAANAERHLKAPADMFHLFRGGQAMVRATRDFLAKITFELDQLAYEYPDESVPIGLTPQTYLEKLTWEGAQAWYAGHIPDKVVKRLQDELDLIAYRNYAPYFLTVYDIVQYARSRDILCQGRGSAANSAVCFVLGITAVDPATSDLLFERFVSREREEPPDIDVDFEHERREEVIQYIYDRYGRHRAALCATVISYRARSAIREVGKALGLSEDITAALASTVWGSSGQPLSDPRVRQAGLDPDNPVIVEAVALAGELIGFPRHLSQHVGGFILTRGRLDETVPIGHAAMDDRTFIEWDKDDIDTLKIMKVDVLALGMLTCIRKAFDLIAETEGTRMTLASVPQEDPETYRMLQRGDSLGVFQVESRAQMNMLPRLKPEKFYDLVIEVAIVRPGPIQGNMVHPYLRRKQKLEPVIYPGPAGGDPDELKVILEKTLGVPLFQEQAMRIAMDAAKFSGDEANELRRAMATFRHMGTIKNFEAMMVERMVARGYERSFATSCFNQIKGFGEYGFPESHATSFAKLVYVSAYLKRHHPAAFAAALLNAQPMGFYAPAQIVRDAREHGVSVLEADVNSSNWDNSLTWNMRMEENEARHRLQNLHAERTSEAVARAERLAAYVASGQKPENYRDLVPPATVTPPPTWGQTGPALRLGLRQIDGFRQDWADALTQTRLNGRYDRPETLMRRACLPKSALERLADADAFRSLGLDRREAAWAVRRLPDDEALPLFAAARTRELGEEAPSLLPLMSAPEQVAADYRTTNLSLKAHPVSFLRAHFAANRVRRCADIAKLSNNAWTNVAGVVLVRQRPGTAKGVVFITIEDETGICNLVVWPNMMEKYRREVMAGRLIEARGPIQRSKEGVTHLIVKLLIDRTNLLYALAEGGTPTPLARADEVVKPDSRADALPPRHPRNVRIMPKSRDFH